MSARKKVIKTTFLVLVWVCLGLFLEILGPTFKDLEIQTGASTEDISRALSGKSVGYFIGAFIGGFIVDKFTGYCNLVLVLCLDIGAIATVIVPWSPNSALLWVFFTLQGTIAGVINIAGQKLVLLIWQKKAPSPLHAIHLGYGIGSFIVPNIANPFLAVPAPISNMTTITTRLVNKSFDIIKSMNASSNQVPKLPIIYIKESNIGAAYIIVAIITGVLSVVFYGYQFLGHNAHDSVKVQNQMKKVESKSLRQILDPATCVPGNRVRSIKLIILLFFFYVNAVGVECMLGKFIRNFSIDQLNFSVDEGSLINTSFWISFSVGRFSGFVAARWIPIRILLFIEVLGSLITSILLNIFARDNPIMLWIFIQPVAFFQAPMYPSAMAWANMYLDMTGSAITFLVLGGATGGVVYLFVIGYFYDNYGYLSFLYMDAAFGVIITLLTVLLTVVGRGHSNKYDFKMVEVETSGGNLAKIESEKSEKERLHHQNCKEDDTQCDCV